MIDYLIAAGVLGLAIAYLAYRTKSGQRRERKTALKRAKEELKKAEVFVAEKKKAQVEAEKKAVAATIRREEVERAVEADREAAGRGDDPIGDLRNRLRRLQGLPPEDGGDQGDDSDNGGAGPK